MGNVVFLIGNGFDLNCGLKSRYTDVYQYYCSKTSNDSEVIKKFKKDLLDNHENWADFEMGIPKYAEKLGNDEELIQCIRDFRKEMKEYLNIEESKFYNFLNSNQGILSEIDIETRKSINTFYDGVSENISRQVFDIDGVSFITFNYTSILDNFIYYRYNHNSGVFELKSGRSDSHVFHIHGSFNTTPVLGLDRIDQLKVPYNLSNKAKRTLIKPTFNLEVDSDRIRAAEELIFKSRYICTFGLSLGLSDLTWRELILSWLAQDKNHLLFIYDYSSYYKENLDDDERLDEEEDLKEKLFSAWEIDSSAPIREQIHMPCGNKIFNYKEVIDTFLNENNEFKKG